MNLLAARVSAITKGKLSFRSVLTINLKNIKSRINLSNGQMVKVKYKSQFLFIFIYFFLPGADRSSFKGADTPACSLVQNTHY